VLAYPLRARTACRSRSLCEAHARRFRAYETSGKASLPSSNPVRLTRVGAIGSSCRRICTAQWRPKISIRCALRAR